MPSGFQGLEVYQEARRLRQRAYKLARMLPDEEKHNLASQMRRAAVSMTNNIAEGHAERVLRLLNGYIAHLRRKAGEPDHRQTDRETD